MANPAPPSPPPGEAVTRDSALGHAARILLNAELETNLPLMAALIGLADSWIDIARTADGNT